MACKRPTVRSRYPPPSFNGLLVIVVAHVLCKHEAGVRFSHGPPRLNSYNAWLAQLVERNVANVQVAGSNPVPRTKFYGPMV